MAETLHFSVPIENRKERYRELFTQWKALIAGERDEIACFANTAAALAEALGFFWVGFYRVIEEELVLGPFQGPIACTRIRKGRGVCGASWLRNETILVSNVDEFPGHIACSSASKSEIVIPIRDKQGHILAILDIDSDKLDDFNIEDQEQLEQLCVELQNHLYD
jgi:L-methionine (R)-S-oxide reductase